MRENACPPVAYTSDLIRVSPHVFQLAEKWSPEKNSNLKNRADRHTQSTDRKHESNKPSIAQRFPQKKKHRVTAAFQSGAFSPFPPGSN